MGLTLTLLILGFCILMILIGGIVYYIGENSYSDFSEYISGVGIIGMVLCSVILLFPSIKLMSIGYDYLNSSTDRNKTLIDRNILERKLQETYNQDNLNEALYFNSLQKKIKIENSSFLQKYRTSIYYVDTIKIPTINYTPKQIIKLEE